jgi:chorismate mutase/prephenate dehydratase
LAKLNPRQVPTHHFIKPDREATILRNILKANENGALSNEKIKTIYKELISGCLSLEEALKISYLGPEGTHSEAAVHGHFGSLVARIPSPTIDDVFHQVLKGESDIGVVPVENSSEGGH